MVIARAMPKGRVVGLALLIALALTYGIARAGWLPRGVTSRVAVGVVTLGTLLAHEVLHAWAAWCYGARPRFGLLWFGAYTTFDERLPRNRYLWTVLAPLVILDAVALVLLAVWPAARGVAYLALLVNTTGAAGDLWSAAALARVPADALIRDTRAGFEAHVPAESSTESQA
ncbi:MAG: DUF3267 domain-containing protein [Candidatus Rokuibacteriota bacterium]